MAPLKILISGATGYIGGSVLSTLLKSKHQSIKDLEVSAIVRGEDKAKFLKEHGINAILFRDLDDSETIIRAASEHDIVINTASGFHSGAAKSFVTGLAERRKATGKDVYYIHTTGTSNLGDKPITNAYHEPRIFSDTEDIYSYLVSRNAADPYTQRTTDLVATDTGLALGVKTYLVMSPTIYGRGTGLVNTLSIQLPALIRTALKKGAVDVIGNGHGVWDAIHIEDLCTLYELLLAKVLEDSTAVPVWKQGIFFSETGDFTWLALAEALAAEMHDQGLIKTAEVNHIELQEAADQWSGGNIQYAELGFASNSRSKAEVMRELGWTPKRTRGAFFKSFPEEVRSFTAG